jgi:hypothetical protein
LAENLVRQVSASGEQLPLKPAHHHDNLKPKILQLASSMMQYVSFLRGLSHPLSAVPRKEEELVYQEF